MIDPIKIITDKINIENKHLILYGAGDDAVFIIHKLKTKNMFLPVCICDSDKTKWQKSLMGIKILSIDEALSIYPEAYIFISPILYKYQIIGQLLASRKVVEERILNYEPVEKRTSCMYLESQVLVYDDKLGYCCSDFGKNKSPYVEYTGDYDSSIDNFIHLRDKLIYNFNKSIPTSCDGCPCLSENYFTVSKKIRSLNFSEGGICNYKCCYCSSAAKSSRSENASIQLPELVKKLDEKKLLDKNLHTTIACGEVSIQSRRKEIYNVIQDKYNFIFSNSSVYDPQIADLIKNGTSILDTSVDAGTRETYAKIKGFDLFEKTRNNLYQYANEKSNGLVELKYIFIPGINDNKTDIDGFVDLCKFVKPTLVILSHDFSFSDNLPQKTIDMAIRMIRSLEENGIYYKILSNKIRNALNERDVG